MARKRTPTEYNYSMPDFLEVPQDAYDFAANLALFMTANGKSIYGTWSVGHMRATDQRRIFGAFLGKGRIFIDGGEDSVSHHVSVCFGTDTSIERKFSASSAGESFINTWKLSDNSPKGEIPAWMPKGVIQ